jgi:general secretion pathway protein E
MPTTALLHYLHEQGGLPEQADSQLQQALQQQPGERVSVLLLRLGLISEERLLQALSHVQQLPIWPSQKLAALTQGAETACRELVLTEAMARRLEVVLSRLPDSEPGYSTKAPYLLVARDPQRADLQDWLAARGLQGKLASSALIAARDLERVWQDVFAKPADGAWQKDLRRMAEDAPVIELVNALLARATDYAASDVHIEPQAKGFSVRYRIDGVMRATETYTRERFDAVVSRIKLVSGLDIAERRLPQDGRFSARMAGVETDVRVSVIPSVSGESLVLRLLPNTQSTRFDLNKLDMEPDHHALYRSWMQSPDGIVLVTGPTGSGKSTTLYATLSALDTASERIMTVEDPVEYQVEGVTQFQVHTDIGFGFPAALRAMLRHDPDTIMVGEIRDTETARIAIQSSLTGHRVFSTLHTNDTATAFMRLIDMGAEPFLVAATVRGIVAQRLLRRLCSCSEPMSLQEVPPHVSRWWTEQGLQAAQIKPRKPLGCQACNYTGYKGRMAVYEMLAVTDALRAAMVKSPTIEALRSAAQTGFRDLRGSALLKVAQGHTSLQEALALAGNSTDH